MNISNLFRKRLQSLYRKTHSLLASEDSNLLLSSIVFSPHPDDETLGCGGTIALKKHLGIHVKVVFMTDGRKSHSHLMKEEKLAELRKREALRASSVLGLTENDVLFLGFYDKELRKHIVSAKSKVKKIIIKNTPEVVYIPYKKETPDDHAITHLIVLSSLKEINYKGLICEYPIWFWSHWPWVGLPQYGLKQKISSVYSKSFLQFVYV